MTMVKFQAWDIKNQVMIDNPIINGNDGSILKMKENVVIGKYSTNEMKLRMFSGRYDVNFQEIWTGDKLYTKDNFDGEEYVGYVFYDEEEGSFVVKKDEFIRHRFIPNEECYVNGHIYEVVENEHQKQDEMLPVGSCDYCCERNRYVKHLNDEYGLHVLNRCLHGCEDERSVVNEPEVLFEVVSVEETYRSYCHDSKWKITVRTNEENHVIHLTRLHSETETDLYEKVKGCRNLHDIKRLNQEVFHN